MFASRGKCYYAIAGKLKYGATAVSDVLTKLSDRFELYALILTRVRSSHLNLFARISTGEVFYLERHAQRGATPALIKHGRNQFLDAYGNWFRPCLMSVRKWVNRLEESPAEIDPDFEFSGV